MKKSKFLTFILSFVPGLGHYYLGQMTRGLHFMVLFFGSIFLFSFLNLNYSFPFFIPIIWFYSLFDALQQHRIVSEEEKVVDQPLFTSITFRIQKNWIGWGLIILGGYMILDRLSNKFLGWQYNELFRNIMFAGVLIIIGWFLVRGKKLPTFKKQVEGEHVE